MNVTSIMKGPRLKVKRANSHIDAIVGDTSPLSKNLYEITNGPGRSVAPLKNFDGFYLTYKPKESISDHLSPIIGDVVNNLREALDYWVNGAVAAIGPKKKLYFPFTNKWENLESTPNYQKIHKAFPAAAEFILNEIKPCRDTNLILWAITSLCNFNKHNDLLPTVSLAMVNNINARIGNSLIQDCSIGGNANSPITMIKSGTPIAIDSDFNTSVDITFPEGAIFENQPIIPTLRNMSIITSQTLDLLERFISSDMK